MSPAKRLSRQRFRALCERCARWATGTEDTNRMVRFIMHNSRLNRRAGRELATACAMHLAHTLARLAR